MTETLVEQLLLLLLVSIKLFQILYFFENRQADVHELIQSTKLSERPKLSDQGNDFIED